MSPSTSALLDRATPIGLDELDAVAALRTRTDRKYLVPLDLVGELVRTSVAAPGTRVLAIDGRRSFRYESVYFDTADLRTYHDAARRRPRRVKIRTRTYVDSGVTALEVKVRGSRGRTVKHRRPHDGPCPQRLDASDLEWIERVDAVAWAGGGPAVEQLGPLVPALTTSYVRATLLIDGRSRLTVDTTLRCRAADGRTVHAPHVAVVETKSSGAPGPVDRLLWSWRLRPLAVSKYTSGMAALHPHLPANRWTPALRRLGWRPGSSVVGGQPSCGTSRAPESASPNAS